MKKIIFVVFSVFLSDPGLAQGMDDKLADIEAEWALVARNFPADRQKVRYKQLYHSLNSLAAEYPDRAEPKIVQACILLTLAELESAFTALDLVHEAKDLLVSAIAIDPDARKGTAVYTLGILYYKVPGWPIAFGDKEKAEEMLLSGLNKNPDGVGNNYYYGEFLLEQNRKHEAEKYIKRAAHAHVPQHDLFKQQIKQKAYRALSRLI